MRIRRTVSGCVSRMSLRASSRASSLGVFPTRSRWTAPTTRVRWWSGAGFSRGFEVLGVDIAPRLIERARAEACGTARFEQADARERLPGQDYDPILCLYDVIGSSAVLDDDLLILRNIFRALRPGGFAVAGVLNTEATLPHLEVERLPSTTRDFVEALERLRPSATMETTGSIFDPEFLLYFNGIYYRKEQFDAASWRLPAELVIRDRRYSIEELANLLPRAGLEIVDLRPVQAGHWDREPPLDPEIGGPRSCSSSLAGRYDLGPRWQYSTSSPSQTGRCSS